MSKLEELLNNYYENNASKLRGIVDNILKKYGGIYQFEVDDFYDIANEVFCDIIKKWDGERDFKYYLYPCLENKIKTEITRRNRKKRQSERDTVRLDAPMGEDGDGSIANLIDSGFSVERHFEESNLEEWVAGKYIKSLSKMQKRILNDRMNGVSKVDTMRKYGITKEAYERNLSEMRSYDKTVLLGVTNTTTNNTENEREETMTSAAITTETTKNDVYTVGSFISRIEKYDIRGDHPLQRNSAQWSNIQKYNLITTVLNGYRIPEVIIAEQMFGGVNYNWLIDGKQRLTTLTDYKNNMFKVGRGAERSCIRYRAVVRNDDGSVVLDSTGAPKMDILSVDVCGKYYKDLPSEVQDMFNDYSVSYVKYLACNNEDIEYHIRRYNAAKPMSAAQKGITHLGEQFARVVKNLSKHAIFQDIGSFTMAEFSSGKVDRAVIESVMASYFIDKWEKNPEAASNMLKANAKVSTFDKFEKLLDAMAAVIDENNGKLINTKDGFLWIALFGKFMKLNVEYTKFAEFMTVFPAMTDTEINGVSWSMLSPKGTKDKRVITDKLDLLYALLLSFLGIDAENADDKGNDGNIEINISEPVEKYIAMFKEEYANAGTLSDDDVIDVAVKSAAMVAGTDDLSKQSVERFVAEGGMTDDVIEDTLLYVMELSDIILEIDMNSPILYKENIPYLMKLVAYANENDYGTDLLKEWIVLQAENYDENTGVQPKDFINKFKTYILYINEQK